MIHLKKSKNVPPSLAVEKQKASGTYRMDDVLNQLKTDFKNKCYICETKDLTSLNVEHFMAHEGDIDLKFDWNNLFLSCVHCNNLKSNKFNNLLNCTSEEYNVDERIKYVCMPFRFMEIEPLDDEAKTIETVRLLQDVYNGTTPLKKLESSNLMKSVWAELNKLIDLIQEYYCSEEGESREYLTALLRNRLSRASAYASIKRWYVKESPVLGDLVFLFD